MPVKTSKLKIVFFICLFSFAFLAVSVQAQSSAGDVNGDGAVNITDALAVARYNAGYAGTLDLSRADVNCDGQINIADALRLAQYSVGLISSLACTIPTPYPSYVPGEVIVGFFDFVTLAQADSLVKSYDLSWEPAFSTSFAVWLEVVQGEPAQFVALLNDSPIVSWAEVRGYSGDPTKTHIIAQIHGTEEEVLALINGMPGLTIVQYVFSPKYGLVKVPAGREREWINTFTSQAIVKYAQLNYITILD